MDGDWRIRSTLIGLGMLGCLALGCSGSDRGVRVKGQIIHDGHPLKFLPAEEIMIGLSQEATPDQKPLGASASVIPEDATFEIAGPNGKGLPPGRYRVSLSSQVYGGNGTNRFEAMFGPKKPPLIAEVGSEKGQSLLVDVGKWTVTKR